MGFRPGPIRTLEKVLFDKSTATGAMKGDLRDLERFPRLTPSPDPRPQTNLLVDTRERVDPKRSRGLSWWTRTNKSSVVMSLSDGL